MALFNFVNGLSADYIDPGYSIALQGLIFTLIVFVYRNQEVLFYIYKGNFNVKNYNIFNNTITLSSIYHYWVNTEQEYDYVCS